MDRNTQHVLPGFEYREAEFRRGLAREITNDGLVPETQDLLDQLAQDRVRRRVRLVYLDTGRAFSKNDPAKQRRAMDAKLDDFARGAGAAIVRYHNTQDPRAFSRKVGERANREAALAYLRSVRDADARRRVAAGLNAVMNEPKPYLRTGRNTDRLYPVRLSLPTVKRELRHALTAGWYEYDLKSTQVAVVSKLWDIGTIRDLLTRPGASFWVELATQVGVPPTAAYKDVLKQGAIYPLIYGGTPWGVWRRVKKLTTAAPFGRADRNLARRILNSALVRELLQHRKAQIEAALRVGSIETFYGERIPVATHAEVRRALARQAHSYELALILPIYDLAVTTDQFTVRLYSFDGVTIAFRDERSRGCWDTRIRAAVKAKADEMGIPTELVCETA